jgi:SAM-dependent methyltransferase
MLLSNRIFEEGHEKKFNWANRPGSSAILAQGERHGFGEFRFYFFGVRSGLANLVRNWTRLGVKKTVGKITQPINSYARFPEYALMEEAIRRNSRMIGTGRSPKVLDVGGPKCFGLYLASTMNLVIEMTDISPLNVNEYEVIWNAIKARAKGHARFALQDARSLGYPANQFDVVYAMSVVEHIEGEMGDADGIREMARVLRPGGLLLLSVPFGDKYVEQWRKGLARTVERTDDKSLHFFQRIYDRPSLEKRIIHQLNDVKIQSIWTVWRRSVPWAQRYGRLGENVRGIFGFLNPLVSVFLNKSEPGLYDSFQSQYGPMHDPGDVLGDVIIEGIKGGS